MVSSLVIVGRLVAWQADKAHPVVVAARLAGKAVAVVDLWVYQVA